MQAQQRTERQPGPPRFVDERALAAMTGLKVKTLRRWRVWEPRELANLLQRDRQDVTDALEELCRREVCRRHPDADNRIAIDRLSVEICDGFWPYEKPPVEEYGIDQNRYVQQARQMLSVPACVRVNFSAADERLAAILYRRGVTLVHLQRAIWLGCARKYVALLNSPRKRGHAHHQLALFLRPCGGGRRNVGGGRLLEAHGAQSEPTGKDVAESYSGWGVIQAKTTK